MSTQSATPIRRAPKLVAKYVPDDVMNAMLSAISTRRNDVLQFMQSEQDQCGGPENYWTVVAARLDVAHSLALRAWVDQAATPPLFRDEFAL
jgi:hypothetical protein